MKHHLLCLFIMVLTVATPLLLEAANDVAPVRGFSTPLRLTDPGPAFAPDNTGENLTELTSVGVSAYFARYLPATGTELWRTDGTATQATRIVKDIVPGRQGSNPRHLTAFNTKLVFSATNALWVSDGSATGTQSIVAVAPASIADIKVAGGQLFFATRNDETQSGQLWVSDGTSEGTKPIAPVRTFALTSVGDAVYFTDETKNATLSRSDGTTQGTIPIRSFQSNVQALTLFHNTIFFVAYDDKFKPILWRSDGTFAGTVPVLASDPARLILREYALTSCDSILPQLIVWHDRLYFGAYSNETSGELWSSDGTEEGTHRVMANTPGKISLLPLRFIGLPSTLLFVVNDGEHGYELWRTNGTATGTTLVRDINPGREDSQVWVKYTDSVACPIFGKVTAATVAGPYLLFTADDGVHGYELWLSDGTNDGTQLLNDLIVGPNSALPDSFTHIGTMILFRTTDARGQVSLWTLQVQPYQQFISFVRH